MLLRFVKLIFKNELTIFTKTTFSKWLSFQLSGKIANLGFLDTTC